jgi:hypothetical protein
MFSSHTTFIGIDPTAGQRPFAYVAVDQDLRLLALGLGSMDEVLAFVAGQRQAIVAVAAPRRPNQGVINRPEVRAQLNPPPRPGRWTNFRLAEYLLRQHSISCPKTAALEQDCPGWMRMGFALYARLESLGYHPYPSQITLAGHEPAQAGNEPAHAEPEPAQAEHEPAQAGSLRAKAGQAQLELGLKVTQAAPLQWLEVYPHACFTALLGLTPFPKYTLEGRIQRQLALHEQEMHIPDPMRLFEEITRHRLLQGQLPLQDLYSPGELDALVAAFTAWKAGSQPGEVTLLGDAQEGQVVLPVKELKRQY